ncbi:hypothetical protein BZL29_8477 [Mycobacterium kansasii]|uniref:Uncharacterized protein n=1 Tax=Mycobacterium kansasii TaxID=1768 RepID=A0A1V3W9K8_MYCKA|nr:hypothetical protein BZL29_8477 [Mycobacterium kansasii]
MLSCPTPACPPDYAYRGRSRPISTSGFNGPAKMPARRRIPTLDGMLAGMNLRRSYVVL